MQLQPQISDLSKPENIQQLASILAELAEQLDVLYTATAPNGNISARQGRIAIYKNGSSYETWQNTTGSNVWQRIDQGAVTLPFQTGDWIVSSVTTARTGWTNKSATYSNKFMRINATPGSTGGADSVTLSEANLPSHTHAAGTLATDSTGAHTHYNANTANYVISGATNYGAGSGTSASTSSSGGHTHTISGSTGAIGSGTSFATVPAYITVTIWEKD